MVENEFLKFIENGGIVALLVACVFFLFKTSKTLYEGRMQDLKESKLNRQHIDLVCEKIDGAISEIKTSKEAIVSELQKQHLISESNSTNQQAMIRMLEQLANTKLEKIENDLIEVKNSTRDTQSILQGIRAAQVARKQENIKLRDMK